MDVTDLLEMIGERYGLLPVYALIVGWAGVQASSVRHLLTMLVIMTGVYAVMFKAFDLKQGLDVFGLQERLGLSADMANGLAAGVFVFAIGFAVYGLKRLILRGPPTNTANP